MADSIESDGFAMEMGALEPATIRRLEEILKAKRLDALVEVNNPIDINPGADDEAHLQIAEAFLQDPNVDAVVVALDPTAPAVRALESSKLRPCYTLASLNCSPDDRPAVRRVRRAADGPGRVHLPQLRARDDGAGALRRGAPVRCYVEGKP